MRFGGSFGWGLALCLTVALVGAQGQRNRAVEAGAVQVLMVSDLHFDPLHDPAKAVRLDAAPVKDWDAILNEADSRTQAADFAALQTACKARGVDTPYALLNSSLKAEQREALDARFVTVTGDLLAHGLDCRYRRAMRGREAGYAEFAEKTARYVLWRLEEAFPRVPVYVALGNNDSSCGDYHMDLRDRFLAATSAEVIRGLRGLSAGEKKKALADYEEGGYYAVTMPSPMRKTRVVMIDDIFLSAKYASCAARPNSEGAEAVLGWLRGELAQARGAGEKVWVLGHIPPGIDVYATLKNRNVCGGDAAVEFLGSEKLAEVLAEYADVVRLAVFAHTHMDEVRLLGSPRAGQVAVKMVGSVSPVDGNVPSFTVGQVNSGTAMLEDYTVYTASDVTGAGTRWAREYGFRQTYGVAAFSPEALTRIIAGLQGDPEGAKPASKAYEKHFTGGESVLPLALAWPQYACALNHETGAGFKKCVCGR